MATFVGTLQEFHHFIGPKVRNAVNGITRKHRSQRNGICETCESKAELHSAHVQGKGRRAIIERELSHFVDDRGTVSCDLVELEARILEAHLPIEHTFRFLCQACHVQYDSGSDHDPGSNQTTHFPSGTMKPTSIDGDFPKLSRISRWAVRPQQFNHKIVRAFLQLERGGEVEYSTFKRHCTEILKVPGFEGHYASMKTDAGNAHGKVFFNEGTRVRMWDRVRKEVDKYFGAA